MPGRRAASLWTYGAACLLGVACALSAKPPALATATALLSKPGLRDQQRALDILGRISTPASQSLLNAEFDRQTAGELPLGLWLELFEAAARQDNPALQARLEARRRQIAASADPLFGFRDCLEGGDAAAGRRIFFHAPEAGCVRCHQFRGEGGQIGPDLGALGQRTDRLFLLESVLVPNATIAPGYAQTLLKLKDGEIVVGLLNAEAENALTLISLVDGRRRRIKTARSLPAKGCRAPCRPFSSKR